MSRTRRKKQAVKRRIAVNAARSKRNERTPLRYFLCNAKRDDRCKARGCRIKRGQEIVYRHEGRVTLCRRCAEADPLVWPQVRPSAKWEVRHHRPVKPGPAWMRDSGR
jgi:hypothetical protein